MFHNDPFISFCDDRKKNLCLFCDVNHEYHRKINLNKLIPDIKYIKKKIETFNNKYNKMKTIVQETIEKMQKVNKMMDK